MKVYVVYYDNGHAYEDHDVSVVKIFLSEESASKCVIDNNNNRDFVPSMTKEEYYSQDADDITQSYEDWIRNESSQWDYYNCGRYFYVETEVFE